MNIQLAEEYKNAEKGEKERGFLGSRSRGSREEGHLEPGLERRSRSRGPREDRCSKEYEHEEEEGLRRT